MHFEFLFMSFSEFEAVIGLEIHIQLKTKRKMFCWCSNDGENQPPNTTICEVCLGHPGTLPVPNKQAIKWATLMALALNCKINPYQFFDRKNYFYPDLPKGYQISQFSYPIGYDGVLSIPPVKSKSKTYIEEMSDDIDIGIERLHLEEDAAKNIHESGKILVDYNRAGTPLIEIVTKPDFRSPQHAKAFLQDLQLIARYLGISDADMEKGHLRCDANVSLRPRGEDRLYPKTEIKNLNSFKSVERALEYEIQRQFKLWQEGKQNTLTQATRLWDENTQSTYEMRTKETSEDYRYFPEPDIPPFYFEGDNVLFDVDEVKKEIGELPYDKRKRFVKEYGLDMESARVLTASVILANYFEEVVEILHSMIEDEIESHDNVYQYIGKQTSKWIVNKLAGVLSGKGKSLDANPVSVEHMSEFMKLVVKREINSTVAQKVLEKMVSEGLSPQEILESEDLAGRVEDLSKIVDEVLSENPAEVEKYRQGKTALLQFFLGQVMKKTQGKADPQEATELLKNRLEK